MILASPGSMPADLAVASIFSRGPTRIGTISPLSAASSAPARAVVSQGCAIAVGIGSKFLHLSSSSSYLPVPGSEFIAQLLAYSPSEVIVPRDAARLLTRVRKSKRECRSQSVTRLLPGTAGRRSDGPTAH